MGDRLVEGNWCVINFWYGVPDHTKDKTMSNEHLYLGCKHGEGIFLTRHSWDCGWYWGFGYIGNHQIHFHMDSLLKGETNVDKVFESTHLTQDEWWIIRDLFKQAYALKEAAEVYRFGGHQTHRSGVTDIIKSSAMEAQINHDLKKVLDMAWMYLLKIDDVRKNRKTVYTREDFVRDKQITLKVLSRQWEKFFHDNTERREVYTLKLSVGQKSYTFDFGQSLAHTGFEPTLGEVLQCLTKVEPGDFEEFCSETGYDTDVTNSANRKRVFGIYQRVMKEYQNVERLFGDSLDQLREFY